MIALKSPGSSLTVKVKMRKCAVCKTPFEKRSMSHKACSIPCAQQIAAAKSAKTEKIKDAARREALKSRTDWLNEAQAIFNKCIRLRDINEPCISCNRYHDGKWNAGHFKGVKAHPELRFSEFNVHKQCEPCNTYLSGNISNYRANLVEIFGEERVIKELETYIAFSGWTIEDAKAIKATYKAKLRALQREGE